MKDRSWFRVRSSTVTQGFYDDDEEKGGRGPVKTRTAYAPCLLSPVLELARDTCAVH
jgi:hypothetical protein